MEEVADANMKTYYMEAHKHVRARRANVMSWGHPTTLRGPAMRMKWICTG